MTPQQILEKIIEKAVKGGYCPTDSGSMVANISADSEHGCWFYEEDGTGKVKPGSKAAARRKSFCARMSGVKGPMKDAKGRPTRKALALRKWKCR